MTERRLVRRVRSEPARQGRVLAPGVVAFQSGLEVEDALTFEQLMPLGAQLGQISSGLGWWVGDWAMHLADRYEAQHEKRAYGDLYEELEAVSGLDQGTIRNRKVVSTRFRDLSRRRDNLSQSHHAEVAALAEAWDRDEWLERAESEGWSQKRLRDELRRALRPAPEGNGDRLPALRLSEQEELSLWLKAAELEGVDLQEKAKVLLNEWATERLNLVAA